jgi:hypothetical protein
MLGEDFSTLTEGSKVVICGGYGTDYQIVKIDRLTKTQVVIGNSKFRRDSGNEIGVDGYSRRSISVAPHLFIRAKQQRARALMNDQVDLTQDGVTRLRSAADYAEKVLREMGKWEA